MRPFGASTPALLISTSSRPKRSTARATTASTSVELADVGEQRLDRAAAARAGRRRVASSDASLTSLSTTSVSGSPAKRARERGAERAARAGDRDDTRSTRAHTSRYPPSTLSTVPVTNADASDARNW